jgi:hypothetical protein
MEIWCLRPLAQAELAFHPPGFLSALFGEGLVERIVAGGYPSAPARSLL